MGQNIEKWYVQQMLYWKIVKLKSKFQVVSCIETEHIYDICVCVTCILSLGGISLRRDAKISAAFSAAAIA